MPYAICDNLLLRLLCNVTDPTGTVPVRERIRGRTVEENLSGAGTKRRDLPFDQAQQCRFSAAVFAVEGDKRAVGNRHGDMRQCGFADAPPVRWVCRFG